MKRELNWLHVWYDGVVHVAIQRGARWHCYRNPSLGLVQRLSDIAVKLEKHGTFTPSVCTLGWSWMPNR